jgi:uncharacterized protein
MASRSKGSFVSVGLVDTARSPHAKLHGVGWDDVGWTDGFWRSMADRCQKIMVPAMGRLMQDSQRVKYLGNFLVAAGLEPGRHRGPRWNDGDFFKWLEAACSILAQTRDADLAREIDRIIYILSLAQRDDGYLHTDIQIRQRAGEAVEPFDNPMDFEMYNMGHLMSAACVHHRVTGLTTLLEIATRAAAYLEKVFAAPTEGQARHGICPSHLMGLVELYRTTADKRWLRLAEKLLAMRDLVTNGDDDNQDRLPFRRQTTAHGHAVRATYLYAGVADLVAETGDAELRSVLDTLWHDLVDRKLYITGGCGALFDGASPDGSEDQARITRVHQAFGRDYQLPHSTAHNETCAAIGNLMWNWRMFLLSGESKYVDLVEETFFNSVLAGVGLDGVSFFYTNTLRQLQNLTVPLRWNRKRETFISCFCCPPNVVRMVAQTSQYAYAVGRREIRVCMYGSNQIDTTLGDGTPIAVRQRTDYPWDGVVRLTIEQIGSTTPVAILLRIPAWSEGATATVNGAATSTNPRSGTFFEIRRAWRAGDVIELNLPMPGRLISGNPLVEETRQQVAVRRGPIVYCLESTDLPTGVRLLDVGLSASVRPEPAMIDEHLGVVLKTPGLHRPEPSWTGSTLYRPVSSEPPRDIELTLIPYFAWGNRGDSDMSVWLPLMR